MWVYLGFWLARGQGYKSMRAWNVFGESERRSENKAQLLVKKLWDHLSENYFRKHPYHVLTAK